MQILRVKCWRAIESYDPARSKQPIDRFVFSCMKNQVKDLLKKRKRFDAHIEDFAGGDSRADDGARGSVNTGTSYFEARYLSAEDAPELGESISLPAELSDEEREICGLLIEGYSNSEIAVALSVRPMRVKELVASLQSKLAPLLGRT